MSCKQHNICVWAPTRPLHGFRGTGAQTHTNTAQNYTAALNQNQPDNLIAVLHTRSHIFTFSVLMVHLSHRLMHRTSDVLASPRKEQDRHICFVFYLISPLLLPIEAHRQTWRDRDSELIEFVLPLIAVGFWGMKNAGLFLKEPWTDFFNGLMCRGVSVSRTIHRYCIPFRIHSTQQVIINRNI